MNEANIQSAQFNQTPRVQQVTTSYDAIDDRVFQTINRGVNQALFLYNRQEAQNLKQKQKVLEAQGETLSNQVEFLYEPQQREAEAQKRLLQFDEEAIDFLSGNTSYQRLDLDPRVLERVEAYEDEMSRLSHIKGVDTNMPPDELSKYYLSSQMDKVKTGIKDLNNTIAYNKQYTKHPEALLTGSAALKGYFGTQTIYDTFEFNALVMQAQNVNPSISPQEINMMKRDYLAQKAKLYTKYGAGGEFSDLAKKVETYTNSTVEGMYEVERQNLLQTNANGAMGVVYQYLNSAAKSGQLRDEEQGQIAFQGATDYYNLALRNSPTIADKKRVNDELIRYLATNPNISDENAITLMESLRVEMPNGQTKGIDILSPNYKQEYLKKKTSWQSGQLTQQKYADSRAFSLEAVEAYRRGDPLSFYSIMKSRGASDKSIFELQTKLDSITRSDVRLQQSTTTFNQSQEDRQQEQQAKDAYNAFVLQNPDINNKNAVFKALQQKNYARVYELIGAWNANRGSSVGKSQQVNPITQKNTTQQSSQQFPDNSDEDPVNTVLQKLYKR